MPTPIMPLGRGRSMFDDFSSDDIVEVARAQDEDRQQRAEIPRTQPNDNTSQRVDNESLDDALMAAFNGNDNGMEQLYNAIEQDAQRSLEAARRIVNVPDQDAYSENAPSQLIDPDSYGSIYHRQQTRVTGARNGNVQQVIAASDQQKAEEAKKLEEAKKNFDNPMAGLDV